jgi:hypothetical protein
MRRVHDDTERPYPSDNQRAIVPRQSNGASRPSPARLSGRETNACHRSVLLPLYAARFPPDQNGNRAFDASLGGLTTRTRVFASCSSRTSPSFSSSLLWMK